MPFWFGHLDTTLYFWKYSLLKPGAVSYFREAQRHQWLPREELEALSWSRTRALLDYAYRNVPFYQERFDHIGLRPEDITLPEHYPQVPVLEKQDIRQHFSNLVSKQARPRDLHLSTTGGSTGEPLQVYHEKRVVRAAMQWRMFEWWGVRPGCTFASVYRQQFATRRARLANWALHWPGRRIHLNAVELSSATMGTFLRDFQRYAPDLLHGYVGAVDELAGFILAEEVQVPPPKVVWVTSAPLTKPQIARIEQAFRAPVCDQYGCCEIYWLAAQCPQRQGLHQFLDVRRIEFVSDDGRPVPDGGMGDILVTDLENTYFPFIRYRLGDRGRTLSQPCPCGRSLPLMDHVRGRISDNLKLPSGRIISGEYPHHPV